MTPPLPRRLVAEALGSFLLFATVVGSGIMGDALAGGNDAVALLGNTVATGAMLFVLITMLGPVSGAHMNPAVSIVAAIRGDLPGRDAAAYAIVQLGAGILGVWCVHLMFELPIVQFSVKARSGIGQAASEALATFGLILTILGTVRHRPAAVPASVALYITAAYWFTSSTSFANPAITVARSLSNSFAGIAPGDVPLFVAAQLAGRDWPRWSPIICSTPPRPKFSLLKFPRLTKGISFAHLTPMSINSLSTLTWWRSSQRWRARG